MKHPPKQMRGAIPRRKELGANYDDERLVARSSPSGSPSSPSFLSRAEASEASIWQCLSKLSSAPIWSLRLLSWTAT